MAKGALFAIPDLQAEGPARLVGRRQDFLELRFLASGATMTQEARNVVRYCLLPGTRVTVSGRRGMVSSEGARLDRGDGLVHYQVAFDDADGDAEALREDAIDAVELPHSPIDQLTTASFHELRPRFGRAGSPMPADPWGPRTWCARQKVLRWSDQAWDLSGGVVGLAGARVEPLPHQLLTAQRALGDRRVRFLFADEVGLGKTIEAGLVLQSLLATEPDLRVLVVAPGTLVGQWFLELYIKFGGRQFTMLDSERLAAFQGDPWGGQFTIASSAALEHLKGIDAVRFAKASWDLVVVDECHRMQPGGLLYRRLVTLTRKSRHVILCSATPPRQHADAEMALLHLLDPEGWPLDDTAGFAKRRALVERVGAVVDELAEAPSEDWPALIDELDLSDPELSRLADGDDREALLAWMRERYRLDHRVVRHRRQGLADLATATGVGALRLADRERHWVSYKPDAAELAVREAMTAYREALIEGHVDEAGDTPPRVLHWLLSCELAAAAHPSVLDRQLAMRAAVVEEPEAYGEYQDRAAPGEDLTAVLRTDLSEAEAATHLAVSAACWADPIVETEVLERLREAVGAWKRRKPARTQALIKALDGFWQENPGEKVLAFTGRTLAVEPLAELLSAAIGPGSVATFGAHLEPEAREEAARRFRDDPDCLILLCDSLGGEGRNFQFASVVVHHDLPWSLAAVEQRVGRVDRFGRDGVVPSWVLVAQDDGSVDTAWARLLDRAAGVFTASASALEFGADLVGARAAAAMGNGGAAAILACAEDLAEELGRRREELAARRDHLDHAAVDTYKVAAEQARTVADAPAPVAALCHWLRGMGGEVRRDEEAPRAFHLRGRHADDFIDGVFDRTNALKHERLQFFSRGNDLVDRLVEDAQNAYWCGATAWRREPRPSCRSWEGLRVELVLGLDLAPLVAAGLPVAALRRLLSVAPPRRWTRFCRVDGSVETDPAITAVLRPDFDGKQGDKTLSPKQSRETWMRPFLGGKAAQVSEWQQRCRTAYGAVETLIDDLLAETLVDAEAKLSAAMSGSTAIAEAQARLAAQRFGADDPEARRLAEEAADERSQSEALQACLVGARIEVAGVAYLVVA